MLLVTYLAAGAVLLFVLLPTAKAGRRFLARWGVPDADEAQSRHAARHLRERRLLYPVTFLLVPTDFLVLDVAPHLAPIGYLRYLLPVVVALVIAEALGALRGVRGPRAAALTRRGWRDLVPKWAVVVLLALAASAVLMSLLGLLAWRTRSVHSESGLVITAVAVGLAAVFGAVRLAVRRPVVADPLVDAALRARGARIAVGAGMALMAYLVFLAFTWAAHADVWGPILVGSQLLVLPAIPVALVGWVLVARLSGSAAYVREVRSA
ncbi:hypothetical protein ABZ816_13540 [Actinosynnema sp. NPDC047251]|uniref:Putative secreted protein n=1 Tax=Saccharothrix espanaensis (strain ATCC 51144 / DSM 44229 / JCM 9112 / NBRC 15066 / NRRL 15764) TaxID=1179773 RepID=K0KFT9_SACES|nr:hypothetical protein [Saccharothrix espanaensis]CCH35619.1 putative secreted protein [Saccharothrix espanaensis DSM 44229]